MLTHKDTFISVEDYLLGEQDGDIRHEMIDGEIYAMTGARVNHNRLTSAFATKIGAYLESENSRQQNCEFFISDMKVRVGDNFFYPDLVVICDENLSADALYTEKPLIIIEVLSKSTRKIDHTIKRQQYTSIPSLQEYILVEQDIAEIEVVRRDQHWQPQRYFLGDELQLESLGLSLDVAAVYQRVDNVDVHEYQRQLLEADEG